MRNPMVVDLNFEATLGRQDHKCKICAKKIDPDDEMIYFRMNQRICLYEAFCYSCGLDEQTKDQERGKKIINEQKSD